MTNEEQAWVTERGRLTQQVAQTRQAYEALRVVTLETLRVLLLQVAAALDRAHDEVTRDTLGRVQQALTTMRDELRGA